MLLPIVALGSGIQDGSWEKQWIQARYESVIDAGVDGALFLLPQPGGGFCNVMMDSSDLALWMREILVQGGVSEEEAFAYSSHACRATALSWAAKAGMTEGDRRLLARQAKPKDRSVLEYSRDALAGPLARVAKVYKKIRNCDFAPDCTSANRWTMNKASKKVTCVEEESDPSSESSNSSGTCFSKEELAEEFSSARERKQAPEPVEEQELDDLACESNLEMLTSEVQEVQEGTAGDDVEEQQEHRFKIYRSMNTGTLHLAHEDEEKYHDKMACYRVITPNYLRMETWGFAKRPSRGVTEDRQTFR